MNIFGALVLRPSSRLPTRAVRAVAALAGDTGADGQAGRVGLCWAQTWKGPGCLPKWPRCTLFVGTKLFVVLVQPEGVGSGSLLARTIIGLHIGAWDLISSDAITNIIFPTSITFSDSRLTRAEG